MAKQYLDDNGNPIAQTKQYLDDNGNAITGQPAPKQSPTPAVTQLEQNAPNNLWESITGKGLGPAPAGSMGQIAQSAGGIIRRGVEGTIQAGQQAVTHPVDTAKGMYQSVRHPINTVNERVDQFKKEYAEDPDKAVQNAAGDVLGLYLQGKIVENVTKRAPAIKRMAQEKVKQFARSAGPGEGVARELVKKTGEDNEAARIKATESTTKAEKVRQGKIAEVAKKHAEDTAKLEAAKAKAATETAKQGKIAPTNAKLDTAHRNLQAGIETAREKALKTGNDKYTAVNSELNPIEVNPEFYEKSIVPAVESIKGSAPEPTFIQNISKRMKAKEPIRYEDLQADYSRLGRELSKGTLPGDVYHAYDEIHEAIGQEMQTIADTKGLGPQLTEARNYWRRMKQAFGKSRVPSDEATEALRTSDPERYAKTIQDKRVNLQSAFDPRLPGLYEHIENLKKGAESLPKPVPAREIQRPVTEANPPAPKVPVKAPPVMPDVQRIGTEEMRSANVDRLAKNANQLREYGLRRGVYAAGAALPAAIIGIVTGHPVASIMGELATAPTVIGMSRMIANVMEKPGVVKFLTEPTAKQIAQITPEMRGQIQPIIKAAQSKGITVNPKLLRAAGVTVAAAANASDAWSGPQQ